MPYAKIHAGREYVARVAPIVRGAGAVPLSDLDAEDAAILVRRLGLEAHEAWVERDRVVVRALGVRNGAPWVPIAAGGLELVHLVELDDVAGGRSSDSRHARTGAGLPTAANLEQGGLYLFRFRPPAGARLTPEHVQVAEDALRTLGLEITESAGVMPSGLVGVEARARRAESWELPYLVAAVPDWGYTGGPPGSAGARAALGFPLRLALERVEPVDDVTPPARAPRGQSMRGPRTGQASAAAPASAACTRLEPKGGAYEVKRDVRYRALVSASKHFDKAAIAKYLSEHGWTSVALYEPGEALPADWPTEPPALYEGLEDNHRWLHGDATRTGEDEALDVVSTLHKLISIRLSVYRIAALWSCTPRAPARAPAGGSRAAAGGELEELAGAVPRGERRSAARDGVRRRLVPGMRLGDVVAHGAGDPLR